MNEGTGGGGAGKKIPEYARTTFSRDSNALTINRIQQIEVHAVQQHKKRNLMLSIWFFRYRKTLFISRKRRLKYEHKIAPLFLSNKERFTREQPNTIIQNMFLSSLQTGA